MATTIAVHGNAVSFAESPGQCELVEGVAWSDIVGLRRGWGTTFRGRAGQFVWFHYDLPAFSLVNDTAHELTSLLVQFDVQGQATVESVHIWNNHNRVPIFEFDGLGSSTDATISTGRLSLGGGAGVSVGVSFRQAADITFRGLIAQLTPTAPPPPPLDVAFTGTATLRTTNDNARGPFTQPFNANFTLSGDRRSITRLDLTPAMTLPFPVDHPTEGPIEVITTVSLQSTQLGNFNPTGELNLQVTLRFSHRNAATGRDVFGAGPSVASFDLTTGTSDAAVRWRPGRDAAFMDVLLTGLPVQPDGRIKVVDNSTFSGGFLGGSEALLEIEGRLNPIP